LKTTPAELSQTVIWQARPVNEKTNLEGIVGNRLLGLQALSPFFHSRRYQNLLSEQRAPQMLPNPQPGGTRQTIATVAVSFAVLSPRPKSNRVTSGSQR
jgi:hypothetical protein